MAELINFLKSHSSAILIELGEQLPSLVEVHKGLIQEMARSAVEGDDELGDDFDLDVQLQKVEADIYVAITKLVNHGEGVEEARIYLVYLYSIMSSMDKFIAGIRLQHG